MKVLVIAPHPDDETLGCGGTLHRHKHEGDEIFWIIVTSPGSNFGWTEDKIKKREEEIEKISKKYQFSSFFNFRLPSTQLDTLPINDLITKFVDVYNNIEPELIYIPFANDVHTDHQIITTSLQSTFKWFRHPYIKKVMMYETLSETDYNFIGRSFKPNVFVNISEFFVQKINAMKIYKSETGPFPFPRSEEAIRSLAKLRCSQSGYKFAEAFQLLYHRQ